MSRVVILLAQFMCYVYVIDIQSNLVTRFKGPKPKKVV